MLAAYFAKHTDPILLQTEAALVELENLFLYHLMSSKSRDLIYLLVTCRAIEHVTQTRATTRATIAKSRGSIRVQFRDFVVLSSVASLMTVCTLIFCPCYVTVKNPLRVD